MREKPFDLSSKKAKAAYSIAKKLRDQGKQAYFAGGCVRDYLLGKTPQDFDIATTATPEEVEKFFEKTIPVGKKFGVMLVAEDHTTFEVATFRCDKGYRDGRHPNKVEFTRPEEDAKRRDFTVNGLFYDPFEEKVIDFVGGQEGLEKREIRAIGEPQERFAEDKLRLLRALRFASSLGFEIEKGTWEAICKQAHEIGKVSQERIRDELIKMFTRPGAARGFMLLSESGLMDQILPEVERMRGIKQPTEFHPEGDVFEHTRLILEKLETPASVVLALGALFHDIGKPDSFALREGRMTFYEHAPIGTKITKSIMKRLRFSNEVTEAVCSCVLNHMKFMDVQKMRTGKLKKFVTRKYFVDELELHRIDCLASHGMLDNYHFLKEKLREYAKEELKPKPLVNGYDLIRLGMKPGPKMKPLLEELYELQLEGKYKTQDEALVWVRTKIQS